MTFSSFFLQSEEGSEEHSGETILRFTPAQLSGAPDILVEVPLSHPFLVKDKGNFSFTLYSIKIISREITRIVVISLVNHILSRTFFQIF